MSGPARDSEDRYALYYPWIHIRNENWLKGTLLAFRQVRRIVPVAFTVKDGAITKRYAQLRGAGGNPLLQPVYIGAHQVLETQNWLRLKISAHLEQLAGSYSESCTPAEQQSGPEAFEMHVGKIVDPALLELLLQNDLAWYSREPGEPDGRCGSRCIRGSAKP